MKNFLYLIMPLSFVLLLMLFLYSKYSQRNIKVLILISFLILYLFSTDIVNRIFFNKEVIHFKNKNLKCDVTVVLTGSLVDRVFLSSLVQKRFNSDLIISGGLKLDNGLSESEFFYYYFKMLDIDSKKITLDNISVNTFQSAKNISKIIRDRKYKEICLVTSEYHIKRAAWSFNFFKINVTAISYQNNKNTIKIKDFVPNSKMLYVNSMYFKELLGLVYYKVKYKGFK